MTSDARIEALEIKVAHLERTAQELSEVLFRQQQLIDGLAARQQRMVERLESSSEAAPAADAQFEIPPHY